MARVPEFVTPEEVGVTVAIPEIEKRPIGPGGVGVDKRVPRKRVKNEWRRLGKKTAGSLKEWARANAKTDEDCAAWLKNK